jgi:hypothetical protein
MPDRPVTVVERESIRLAFALHISAGSAPLILCEAALAGERAAELLETSAQEQRAQRARATLEAEAVSVDDRRLSGRASASCRPFLSRRSGSDIDQRR